MQNMATRRTELRGFTKQSQKTSADESSTSYLNSSGIYNEIPVRTKRSSHSGKEECVNNDELVKYMSKLPGYLQRMERGEETVQSNVLNVGVLDWGRLEKWKHGRAKGGECERKLSSSSSTVLETVPKGGSSYQYHRCKIDDQVHACSVLGKVKASRGLQHSAHQVKCTLDPEFSSRDSLNKQETATCSYKSSVRDHERVKNPVKSRRSRSHQKPTSGLLSDMGNSGGSLGAKGDLLVRDTETENSAGEIHSQEARERASDSEKQCDEKLDGEEEKNFGDSRLQSRNTLSGEPQMLLEDKVNGSLHFSSHCVGSSLGSRSQVPRSSPLSFDLERDAEDMVLPLGVDLSGKKERFGGRRRHSKTVSRIFDQEMREDESKKNRHTSPSKRFSFSFGRLSRSFTFKEDSAGQPLSSSDDTIKSDSMRFDGSACPSQSSNPEKQNIRSGSRVSPLRRLLDPLLKSKGSENVLPSKASPGSSDPKPANMDAKIHNAARTRALFQLTTRNGIPLFQFVVDDNQSSRSILGATMKHSVASLKDDSVQYCTFYSVDEVKKKRSGSWLIHGHKEKQCRFVYNVIGQMRLCNSMSSDITEKKPENVSSVVRESVLVDETEQVKGRKEVAAIVIKKKPAEENLNALKETTVILPGGVHSIPEKGEPTPLVSRWRTGGICDCGGWDVGCKLHVLSNKTLLHELDQSFKLFNQEESDQDSGPVLTITELKTGIYRVEFGSFLSHLQAFFVCVTVITCAAEEETVSKTTGKSSSTFAPPLSPVGRV